MKKYIRSLVLIIALFCAISLFSACNNEQGDDNSAMTEYYIKHNGMKIELGKDAEPILAAMGTPKDVTSLGDCGGFGAQTRYTYDDFVLYTVKNDSGETVDQIALTSDIIETPKGICVGDSDDEVLEAYGEPVIKNDKKIEYESGSLVLKFGLEDGAVKSINFIRITASAN